MIKLLVGLGNDGEEYISTRHNQGFRFLDKIALTYKATWMRDKRFQADIAFVLLAAKKVLLLKPKTYMNCSGLVVNKLIKFYQFTVSEILVVHDELDLAPGVVKFKQGGSTAGHNGLKSIAHEIGSFNFMRLRFGIGHPRNYQVHNVLNVGDYVLARPQKHEEILIEAASERVLENLVFLIQGKKSIFQERLCNKNL